MLELTITLPYLTVTDDSEVSFPPQLQREKGGVQKVPPNGWAHFYQPDNNGRTNRKRESTRKGEARGET